MTGGQRRIITGPMGWGGGDGGGGQGGGGGHCFDVIFQDKNF